MKRIAIVSGLAVAAASLGFGAAAQAETLSVNTTVAPYCGIRLANVSSGTASVAHENEQTFNWLATPATRPSWSLTRKTATSKTAVL